MIGVIADDLTGAAELGAVGRRLGLKAEILCNNEASTGAELVCVDTDSRSCPPTEAAKRAAQAAKMLQAAGARWIYKKVDSVLRGNVTPEVEAVMQQLGFNRALVLPANPSLGRTIRDGQYLIQGKPIHLTEFAHDPEYPRRTSQVLRMVEAPQHFLLRLANGGLTVPENTLLMGQADSPEKVRQWAQVRQESLLRVGGSEFFGALLSEELRGGARAISEEFEFGNEQQLFVCGTASKSGQHLFRSARKAGTPVFTLPQELMWGNDFSPGADAAISQRVIQAFENNRRVVLGVGLPPVQDMQAARRLSGSLVDIAQLVLKRANVKYIFAEGGATSAELVRRMKWSRLEVRREWAPGVATLAVTDRNPLWLTIKPGSYSWPRAWTGAA
ncbi:MAG TPA: four-carbon acid sugar kinase family protein [Candidatus Angelobacter sp.]|nr:four-carbon acid sugar kinase family protein [Candidatus Angelobacter sp.]